MNFALVLYIIKVKDLAPRHYAMHVKDFISLVCYYGFYLSYFRCCLNVSK